MTISPDELPARLRALPAAAPLFDVLAGDSRLHVVGGAVRDLLLGGLPIDLDLVVEGDAASLAERLAEGLGGELLVHDRFGTATVTAGVRSYDLVRARAETYARPGALPEVRPGTLAEDLARRDFTVNAIALTLAGRLDAVAHALEDLAARQLRVLHAQSFVDDPTRLLRLVRYATRLGFAVERETARLAGEAVAGGALATVTATRIGRELRLLLREPSAPAALEWVCSWGDGGALVPGLGFDAELAARAQALLAGQGGASVDGGAAGADGAVAGGWGGRHDLLLLAVATRGVGARLGAWLDALGFSAREREAIVAAAQRSGRVAQRLRAADGRPSAIAAALRGAGPELAALAGALGGEEAAAAVVRWRDELRHVRLEIDGGDLRGAGLPQGAAIGRGLAAALAAKLDGEVAGRDDELAVALAAVEHGGEK